MPKTYTVNEVAQILGYSTNSIYTFLKEKRIKGVRVGKGRFRIPEEELSRILHLSKKSASQPTQPTITLPQAFSPTTGTVSGDVAVLSGEEYHDGSGKIVTAKNMGITPNFFDWYLGSVASLAGATVMLFSPLFEGLEVSRYLVFRPFLMTILIVGGLGLLYADVFAKKFTKWRGVFYGFILVGLTMTGGLFFINGDYPWVCIMALIVGMGIVRPWTSAEGVRVFCWHIGGIWILFALSVMVWPNDERIVGALQLTSMPLGVSLGVVVAVAVLFTYVLLGGNQTNRRLFTGLMVSSSLFFVVVAFWLGTYAYWLRAFVFLTMGFFALFAPVWELLALTRREHQRTVYQLVGGMFAISLFSIVLLRLFQENSLTYVQNDLKEKATISALTITSTMEKTTHTLEVFAQNPLLVRAIVAEKDSDLAALSRGVYESQVALRRMVITSEDGTIRSYYPLQGTTPTTQTLGQREYFIQAVATKKTVVSDVVNSSTSPSRPSVAIAVPIIGENKAVIGMVIGSVDLDSLNLLAQKIVRTDRDEYVTVVDRTTKRIMHPDSALLGKEVRSDDSILHALSGESGVADDYSYEDDMAITAYIPVADFDWALSVKVSKRTVLGNTSVSVITVLALTSVWVGILGYIIVRHGLAVFPMINDTS